MKKPSEEPEGCEPTEEVGPPGCDPSPTQVEQKARDMDESPDASHPKFSEEIQDSYAGEAIKLVISPDDGLPIPVEANELDIASPFTIDHVVCVEDDRAYVELFRDEATIRNACISSYKTSLGMDRLPKGPPIEEGRFQFTPDGEEQMREVFAPENTVEHWGMRFGLRDDGTLVHVRPKRERCKYYKRQIFANDANEADTPGSKIVYRNCMIRKSVGGAFMSLRDEAVFACDYRDPSDRESTEKHLDAPDREHLRSDAHKKKLPLFRSS
jgi:hypothetical protein